ncbi:MAG: flagellar biosynthetic protein FliQ [Gammaproteobacteria bacterium]|jgi:flagellar biosynthetic protein FliQ|nr:MAG: flagellar biosynthetic protein FliQ [Gammaproteobacteria bacterium]
MTPEVAVDLFRQAMQLVVLLVAAIIIPGLLVGLIVAIFQAATSINEQTLSFLPRLVVTLLTMAFLGHWFVGRLMDFMYELVSSIPTLIG